MSIEKPSLIVPSKYYSKNWKHQCVDATGGNQSLLGCFVLAILGWQHGRKPPRFGNKAYIDKAGLLYSNMQAQDGRMFANHCLGPVEEVRDNLRGLADFLKLDDHERVALFDEFRKWILYDSRADQSPEERKLDK